MPVTPPPTCCWPPAPGASPCSPPLLADTSPQARSGGYTTAAFTIDWDTHQATCPQGATSTGWSPCTQRGTDAIVVRFDAATCRACPAKPMCTTATRSGRQLSLRPRHVHEAVEQARAAQSTDRWHDDYKIRAGVEGTMRQTTHVTGIRRARYLGLPKTTLEHNLAAAAINLIRYDAWLTGRPLDRTRTTHLQRLFALATPGARQGRGAGHVQHPHDRRRRARRGWRRRVPRRAGVGASGRSTIARRPHMR